MITNFEEITEELTPAEMDYIPVLIRGFNTHTKVNPIKAADIVKAINQFMALGGHAKSKMTEPRLRKCVNYIRANSLLPLIATSEGYFVSDDPGVIKAQITSLVERANSILRCANGLRTFIP